MAEARENAAAPYHAHVYFTEDERAAAAALHTRLGAHPLVLFAGRLCDGPVGPHPIPQFEIHFRAGSLGAIEPLLAESGLSVLIHPLTTDDLADHTTLGRWLGTPVPLDVTVLDPPGINQGFDRFGKSDF